MTIPTFTFDADANGYISDPFTVDGKAVVKMRLASRGPVVTLKQEKDGGYANYGQSPKSATDFKIAITTRGVATLKLATPVTVTECYIQ